MAGHKNHDYHILPPSIWPLTGAVGGIVMLGGAVLWFHDQRALDRADRPRDRALHHVVLVGRRDRRGRRRATTPPIVQIGLRYGMVLFIISEIMFFSAWFWTFFKHALYPMRDDRGRRRSSPAPGRRPASRPSTPGTCR